MSLCETCAKKNIRMLVNVHPGVLEQNGKQPKMIFFRLRVYQGENALPACINQIRATSRCDVFPYLRAGGAA